MTKVIQAYILETKRTLKEIGQEFFLISRDSEKCGNNCKRVRWLFFINLIGLIGVAIANVTIS